MPLTDFQKIVLRLLARNRSEESYVAGGIALNAADNSHRFSNDIDLFHDVQASTMESAERDCALLATEGYRIEWGLRLPGFCQAIITKSDETLKLEWSQDSAFRFFPVVPDPEMGFRLHMADLATNKVLACGGRRAPRDFIDLIYLHSAYLHAGALIWAACGKDPGFSPESLLELIDRNKALAPQELAEVQAVEPLNAERLRTSWITIKEQSLELFDQLPAEEIGCLYLDFRSKNPVIPEHRKKVSIHRGSLRGCWPRIGSM
jgi:hypothetical protein